jgi:hypothetical protein
VIAASTPVARIIGSAQAINDDTKTAAAAKMKDIASNRDTP